MDRAVGMLSGGLDSAVSLAAAARRHRIVIALTFDYGQRAARREISASRAVARWLGVPHRTIRLPWLAEVTETALVNPKRRLPRRIDGLRSAAAVWVPNRNGVFLNVCAAFAERLRAKWIVTGFNAEEAATFPDNSAAYVRAANRAFSYSTSNGARVVAYTGRLEKPAIVRLGRRLGVPLDKTWSCYEGGAAPCGTCESCQRRKRTENPLRKGNR